MVVTTSSLKKLSTDEVGKLSGQAPARQAGIGGFDSRPHYQMDKRLYNFRHSGHNYVFVMHGHRILDDDVLKHLFKYKKQLKSRFPIYFCQRCYDWFRSDFEGNPELRGDGSDQRPLCDEQVTENLFSKF